MPKISVIVPVYQGEACINSCAQSVLDQTFSDWELLLVDDGSTDASPALCDALAARDSRIRALHQPKNAGVSQARNRGMAEARGQAIAFLDADDAFVPTALQTLWDLLQTNGADTAACAHLCVIPGGGERVELCLPAGVYGPEELRAQIVEPLLGDRLCAAPFNGFIWRYLFSAQLLREGEITFEGAYLEDDLFLMEYFCQAKKLAVTQEPLYRYVINPNSVTHRYMGDFPQVFARFLERKEALVKRFDLARSRPQWRENTLWSGLLIAVGNEYAPGNPKTIAQRKQTVRELCATPEMSQAIATLRPQGMGRNKQLVADLIRGGHFGLLHLLYRVKNRI